MSDFFKLSTKLFDSHAHLNDERFDADLPEVVARATTSGIEKIVDVGTDLTSSKKAVENAKKFLGVVYAAIGIDPDVAIPGSSIFSSTNITDSEIEAWRSQLTELCTEATDKVVAIGETGVDNYWLSRHFKAGTITKEQQQESLDSQQRLLRMHLELAQELNLPVTLHSRAAEELCLEVVKDYPNLSGIFHSFTGDVTTAKGILDAGWSIGINGIVTFEKDGKLLDICKNLFPEGTEVSPENLYKNGIFIETDAPYLAPQSKRGERNEPANCKEIYDFLSTHLN